MLRRTLCIIAATFVLTMPDARAAACAPGANPFADIPDGIFFCTNTLWLRNANVTLGCSSGGGLNFCPDEFVPRSQMALFMNRLARALTPEVFVDVGGPPTGDLDTDVHTCASGVYTVTSPNLQHFGTILANLSILTDGDADIGVELAMRKGGNFFPISSPTMNVHVPANKWTMVSIIGTNRIQDGAGTLSILPGETFGFRVTLRRVGSATTGEVVNTRCQIKADMLRHWNQN